MNTATLGTVITRRVDDRVSSYPPFPKRSVSAAPPANAQPSAARVPGIHLATGVLTIAVHHDLAPIQASWAAFEKTANGTIFQNSLWCRAWLETVGAQTKARPVIVTGQEDGCLRFLIPLQIRRRQGVRVLEWLGTPNHNYGYPLVDRKFAANAASWFAAHWRRVLQTIGGFDAIALTENPEEMFGRPHPLLPYITLRGAAPSFDFALSHDFEALHRRKLSSGRLRLARSKEAALASRGAVGFGQPADKRDTHELLDTMFEHHQLRLSERGVHSVFSPVEKQFFHRIVDLQDSQNPLFAPYRMTLDGQVIAVWLGAVHANTFWALTTSIAPGDVQRQSPGDLAMRRTIKACCERGLAQFDFSSGDFGYKRQWSDRTVESFAVLEAVNLRGLGWAAAMALALVVKRKIKRTPMLFNGVQLLRRMLFSIR